MSETNSILPLGSGNGKNERLPEDKLLQYLDGNLSPAEQHEVEQWLADEGMESDAVEGLQNLQSDETRKSINKLNHRLRKNLQQKKHKRRLAKTDYNTLITMIVILMLALIAYIVFRKAL